MNAGVSNGMGRCFRLFVFAFVMCLCAGQSGFAGQARIHAEMIESLEAYALQKMGQHEEAFAKWMALAQRGNAQGILNVANAYQEGNGVTQDRAEAVRWYLKGAEQGDPHCLYNLARAYEMGLGVPADKDKADAHFQLAAGAGSADAQLVIGRTLLDENKHDEARQWLERSAADGNQEALRLLANLAPSEEETESLTGEQGRRVARLLDDLDAAANARDADLLTGPIDEDAKISVRLPGQPSAQSMTKDEYRALWQVTFDKAERYRFTRTEFDKDKSGEAISVNSNIREYLTSGDRTQLLVLNENMTLDLSGTSPRITRVSLHVERR